jgi:pyruvate,water dikinase
LRAAIPRLREQFGWVQELPVAWMRDLDHYLVTLGRFQAEALEGRTPLEIWRHVLAVNEHGAQYFLPNIAISIAQGSICVLHGLLKLAIAPADADGLFDHLMAWCETRRGKSTRSCSRWRYHPADPALAGRITDESKALLQQVC